MVNRFFFANFSYFNWVVVNWLTSWIIEGNEISIKADFRVKLGFKPSDKAQDFACFDEPLSRGDNHNHYVKREGRGELIHNEKIKIWGNYPRWMSWEVTRAVICCHIIDDLLTGACKVCFDYHWLFLGRDNYNTCWKLNSPIDML